MRANTIIFILLFFAMKNIAQNQVAIKVGYEFFCIRDISKSERSIYSFDAKYTFAIGAEISHSLKNRNQIVLDFGLVQRKFYYREGFIALGGRNTAEGDYNITLLRISPRYDVFIIKNLSIGAGLAGTYAFLPVIKGVNLSGNNQNQINQDIDYSAVFGTQFGISTSFSAKYTFGKWGIQFVHYNNFIVSKTTAVNLTYLIRSNQ
jgi:hypothetical protein